jgi:hypothetical protein
MTTKEKEKEKKGQVRCGLMQFRPACRPSCLPQERRAI